MTDFEKARALLHEFKGSSYLFGADVLPRVGEQAAAAGKKAALVRDTFEGSDDYVAVIRNSLAESGVSLAAEIRGAGPNCPREDLFRIAERLRETDADVVVSFGGGSTIDAAKAAEVLRTLGGDIDEYFGVGLVTKALQNQDKSLTQHVAIQTVASSAAHLTKYSNITEVSTGQKKLIVDEAIVPAYPVFDYAVTYGAPPELTADGALDGIAHSLEVLYGAVGKGDYDKIEEIACACISLAVNYLPAVVADPKDTQAREALCLATDLGGYSIMVGAPDQLLPGGHTVPRPGLCYHESVLLGLLRPGHRAAVAGCRQDISRGRPDKCRRRRPASKRAWSRSCRGDVRTGSPDRLSHWAGPGRWIWPAPYRSRLGCGKESSARDETPEYARASDG